LTLVEGPYEVVSCAQPNYILVPAEVVGVANQDDRQSGTESAQPAQNVQAIGVTFRKIEQE
jgi:hypothetical protein